MSCTGPSKEAAFNTGEKAYQDVLELLQTKYHIAKKPSLFFEKDWEKAEKDLKLAIQEMIWVDHCDGW